MDRIMGKQYDLTIIIPHYNTPALLRVLLASIPPLEAIQVIVVDDHSTKELEILEEVKKQYAHATFLENTATEKGAGSARNLALHEAKGTWTLFADADDYFLPDFYSKMQGFLQSSYDIIFFTPTSVELDTGNPSDRHVAYQKLIEDYKKEESTLHKIRLLYQFTSPCSKIIRTSLIVDHKLGFGSMMVSEDVLFSVKCSYLSKEFFCTEQVIYCITRSKGSLTTIINPETLHIQVDVLLEEYLYLKTHLSKQEFRLLNLTGKYWIFLSLQNKLGVKVTGQLLRKMIGGGIPLVSLRDFSFQTIFKKLKRLKQIGKEARNYNVAESGEEMR